MFFSKNVQKPEQEPVSIGFTAEYARRYNIVAIGRAYTDIISSVSTELLQMYKIPIDGQRECSVQEVKKIQETLSESHMVAGGSSANTVAIISALGGKAGFFGKVYCDTAGLDFLKDLKQRNVDLNCRPYAETPQMSATCLVLLTDNKRSFAYNPGCSDHFSSSDFDKFDFTLADFFLIEAHLLTSPIARPAIMEAMERAKNKSTIVINLQGITYWGVAEVVQYITSKANIIIGNQDEQIAFAKAIISLQLSRQTSQLVITTKGADGAEISQFDHVLYHIPAEMPKKFVSSIGAGDAFIAGFLLGQSRGMSLEESMRHAVKTATAILEEMGARPTKSLVHLFPTFSHTMIIEGNRRKQALL